MRFVDPPDPLSLVKQDSLIMEEMIQSDGNSVDAQCDQRTALEALRCAEVDLDLLHYALLHGDPKRELVIRVEDLIRHVRGALKMQNRPRTSDAANAEVA